MTPRARLLSVANVVLTMFAWVSMATTVGWASIPRASLLAVTALVAGLAVGLTLLPGLRAWWGEQEDRLSSLSLRAALVMAPWAGLLVVIWLNGLWWTQRPSSLRLVVLCLGLNWVLVWTLAFGRKGGLTAQDPRVGSKGVRRAVLAAAGLFGTLGAQGLVFGLTPFGCGLSAVLTIGAAGALLIGCRGRHPTRMGLLAASAATLVTVCAIEIGVRVTGFGANIQEQDRRQYARQFYSLTPPGTAFMNRPTPLDEFPPALVDINSRGMRGPEQPDGRADLMLVGDSFVEARQLAWERTVTPQVQDVFRQRSIPASVVGHGMRGWSPLLEWNWYLKTGRTFRPRTVILFFFWNDLWPEGDEVRTFRAVMTDDGRPDYFDVLVEPAWIWYQHVRLLQLIQGAWQSVTFSSIRRSLNSLAAEAPTRDDERSVEQAARRQSEEPPLTSTELDLLLTEPEHALTPALRAVARSRFWPGMRPLPLWTDAQLQAASKTEQELARFSEDVARDHGRPDHLYVPNPLQVGVRECSVGRFVDRVDSGVLLPADSGVQAWLRTVTARHGIQFMDPSAAMRSAADARGDAPPFYLRADCHWSAAGHRFVADFIADWYQRAQP